MSQKNPRADADFIALQQALAGEYSLDREIGRGGMGIVYLAREVRLARSVAIKVLPPALAARADLRDGFLRESQTVARLTHPNIVPVYAAGERDGFVYIVMALVDGVTLGERIRTRGPLLPGQAARVLREVAWALAYAHAAGIVHRDVSAENIILERGTDRAIVMDFGIASAMWSAAVGEDGRVMGSAHYISPEQAVGEPVDARSDLYSLGVCGYYALTGRLPFDGPTPEDVVRQHLTREPPPITSLASAVPRRLGQAVDRCLAKEPMRRYRTAESFAEAIDLAFEHAKDIPAPLRVWIGRGEREGPARMALIGVSALGGLGLVSLTASASMIFVPVAVMTMVTSIPPLLRLRRVLGDGFHTEDLQMALREHSLLRSEELEYERAQTASSWAGRLLKGVFGASVVSGMFFARQLVQYAHTGDTHRLNMLVLGIVASLAVLGLSSVTLVSGFVRLRLGARLAAASIDFWGSRWAERLARVVGVGVVRADRPTHGMPMLTEVALGRATDHLFQSLPKVMRQQLAMLPETVRTLEREASRLRATLESLDEQLSVFGRGERTVADDERAAIEEDTRAARELSATRLSATVGALESIRLELLRLQLGNAGIDSVTASLEAARRVGEQIAYAAAANVEIERLLASTTGELRAATDAAAAVDDDADTPVGGVPATRG